MLGHSEITKFDLVIAIEHNILQLDVSVDDLAHRVQVVDRIDYLHKQNPRQSFAHRLLKPQTEVKKVASLRVLHQYVVADSLRLPDLGLFFGFLVVGRALDLVDRIERHNVRVNEQFVQLCLLLERLDVLATFSQKFSVVALVRAGQRFQAIVLARSHVYHLVNSAAPKYITLRRKAYSVKWPSPSFLMIRKWVSIKFVGL